ncbi:LacI family transcriptional regulator [Acidovorax sp. Root275]|uniref:ABC transporter substrate-binding protein n=1 Tax=unclassified Acidovorax TaxID=2684926 RepID=UPI00070C8B3D|nr:MULTISPECIES: substrate-binding domain-containing protein [unclassified Acidovorax]KRD18420.1 LacI family transcriptional regulator [Acidovorax sp. Root267]KRD55622.1 LacI family transcriptional regulator [Acidovorax sp. Root275]
MNLFFRSVLVGCWLLALCTARAAEKDVNIVFIPKSSDQVFWELMRIGVDKAVKDDGQIKLTWRGPEHNDDTDSQIKIVQLYTKPGVDAILIAPTDRARLVESVQKAVALGIQVIAVDSGLDGNLHLNFVTSDNYAGGQLAAKTLAGLLQHRGKVAMLRTVAGSASTDERARGFVDYLKEKAPKITLVADVYGGGSIGKARHSATQLLAAHPGIDGVFAVNESSTDGMLRALRDKGLAGKLRFIGFDSTDFLLTGLEQQEIHGLVIQNPTQMGYKGIQAAAAAARNQAIQTRTIFTDITLVTRANYKTPDIQKLMCSRC